MGDVSLPRYLELMNVKIRRFMMINHFIFSEIIRRLKISTWKFIKNLRRVIYSFWSQPWCSLKKGSGIGGSFLSDRYGGMCRERKGNLLESFWCLKRYIAWGWGLALPRRCMNLHCGRGRFDMPMGFSLWFPLTLRPLILLVFHVRYVTRRGRTTIYQAFAYLSS